MAEGKSDRLATIAQSVQVVSVIVGLVISVLSFTAAQRKESEAREKEAEVRLADMRRYDTERREAVEKKRIESAQPFLKLRQKLYLETVTLAAILSNPSDHTPAQLKTARTRFRQLYVAELSMVEGKGVESGMEKLAAEVDPELSSMTDAQVAAYELAHKLRDSLVKSWGVDSVYVDNPQQ